MSSFDLLREPLEQALKVAQRIEELSVVEPFSSGLNSSRTN